METTYFTIDAKRILVCGEARARRAAGDGGSTCYAVIPRRKSPAPARGGKVLDFNAYRNGGEEVRCAAEPQPEEAPAPEPREPRASRLPLLLDLVATGAVAGMALTVTALFLNF